MPRRKPLPVMVKRSQPPGVGLPAGRQNPPHRVPVAAAEALKAEKSCSPGSSRRGRGHGVQIEFMGNPPAVMVVQGGAAGAVEDAVFVSLGEGRFAGVKLRRGLPGLQHRNIIGQHGVEPFVKGLERDGAAGAETGHLAQGVHPGVGAPGADELDRLPGEALQGLFQNLLNGEVALLALPAVVAGAVVFQQEADIAASEHIRSALAKRFTIETREGTS